MRFARPSRLEEDWEAGANPALPRNCKRGHCSRPLGPNTLGRAAVLFGTSRPYSQSQETGANPIINPFRVQRRIA